MINRGVATFGLDYGKCPPWLWQRMVKLGRQMIEVIVEEYGPDELVRRLSEPGWFQSLGTVLAFDWNASGLTTILTAAIKESVRGSEGRLGIYVAGGKGKTSLKTPDEIIIGSERAGISDERARTLVYNSKMAAKIDSGMVQDGFQLYHHTFFFSRNGAWTVVQQGMNKEYRSARRYHWHSASAKDLVVEPHSGISSPTEVPTLDLTARVSLPNQRISTELVQQNYSALMKDIQIIYRHSSELSQAIAIKNTATQQTLSFLNLESREYKYHPVILENFRKSKYLERILYKVTERKPETYERLVSLRGVGPKTLRALSLVAEVIYGARPSYVDPARYGFAHGGKDATPYAVDKNTYDSTIEFFARVIPRLKISTGDKQRLMSKIH